MKQYFHILLLLLLSGICFAQDSEHLALHDNDRTMVYPRIEHELYLNPPPLLVPISNLTQDSIRFALSPDPTFPIAHTQHSSYQTWAMFTPHRELSVGIWYWRFRQKSRNGTESAWSQTYSFTVKQETPRFANPPLEEWINRIPSPENSRLYGFLTEGLERLRPNASNHPEYKTMINRSKDGLTMKYKNLDRFQTIRTVTLPVLYMYQSYRVTGDESYATKLVEIADYLATLTFTDKELGAQGDFFVGDCMTSLLYPLDACYSLFSEKQRIDIEQALIRYAQFTFKSMPRNKENHIMDNHFWQHTITDMTMFGLLLHDQTPLARTVLEYCYDLWTARYPCGGFNHDGQFYNSIGYFNTDMHSLYYMSAVLSHLTGVEHTQHPYFQNNGFGLLYTWPPKSHNAGFGDGYETGEYPYRVRLAYADYIAHTTACPYAKWYVQESNRLQTGAYHSTNDYLMRLFRMAHYDTSPYEQTALPNDRPKMAWFKDSGEAMMHSCLENSSKSLFLGFRSSPFGSGSHTLADQNSFNLLHKGKRVYCGTGYYLNFSDRHNLLSYRHTRAHNSLLIDGVGQSFTTRAYGNIVRGLDGKNISYALGDASTAYACLSEYPMWIKHFQTHAITQTPDFGFGITPLTKYRRHVAMLHPDKVVIYDELEASRPVRWDWLLHANTAFDLQPPEPTLQLEGGQTPLAAIESGAIESPCEVLSFDYMPSTMADARLQVYANDRLLHTLTITDGYEKWHSTDPISLVGIQSPLRIRIVQADSESGSVVVRNLRWGTTLGLETENLSAARVSVAAGTIFLHNCTPESRIELFDLSGQLLMNHYTTEIEERLSPPSQGVYLVRLISENQTTHFKILVP